MIANAALDELAERCGIEAAFVDAHGIETPTSAEVKRSLLAALGLPAADDRAVERALATLDDAQWEQPLPPVVVSAPADLRVALVLPVGCTTLRWRLTLESGDERSATVDPRDLPLLDETQRNGHRHERRELALPTDLALGYHQLHIDDLPGATTVIVTPERCWLPPSIEAGKRMAGIAIQLYLLRSDANWGIGDFTDLRRLVDLLAVRGLDVVGLNPLHEMFVDDPEHASPYSPASRLLLNVLNIDVSAIPEFARCVAAQDALRAAETVARLAAVRQAAQLDYSNVSRLKLEMLRHVYATFSGAPNADRQAGFAAYRSTETATMRRTHVFVALREHFAAQPGGAGAWQNWPSDYRDPASPAVAGFAQEYAAEIDFIAWLQWIADTQLAQAAEAAQPMRVGLYRDLAVGADPGGAETWSNQQAVVDAARVGAPPDIHNPAGQNWDLPPFHPRALRAEAYRSFIELVRANMRHAGGIRIDHVMALQHLYWIPVGSDPAQGAYVRYPLDDLVGILALESQRARCLVVGEDLGTVPAGFRERMAAANVLSYRVLFFEREADERADFIAPDAYPSLALAVLGSHDLPTLRAWWKGADIRLRQRLGLEPDTAVADRALQARGRDREALVTALERAGAIESGSTLAGDTLFTAAHAFLTKTAAALAVAQIDDITDELDPVNVPTTADEHPNWRRRLSRSLEELPTDARFAALCEVLASGGRLRPEPPPEPAGLGSGLDGLRP